MFLCFFYLQINVFNIYDKKSQKPSYAGDTKVIDLG